MQKKEGVEEGKKQLSRRRRRKGGRQGEGVVGVVLREVFTVEEFCFW